MSKYAIGTTVSEDRSRVELERVLLKYGCNKLGVMTDLDNDVSVVMFEYNGWPVKMVVPMPSRDDKEFIETETGRERSESVASKAWEQARRQRWRVIVLMVKAKFEAILAGSASFEREFMSYFVLPGGRDVGDEIMDKLLNAKERGELPRALPEFKI